MRLPLFPAANVFRTLAVLTLVTVSLRAAAPAWLNYQGRVAVDGVNFSGTGEFKFALVAGGGAVLWRNDGVVAAGEPGSAVSLPVASGLYSLQLGDTALPNMAALPVALFSGPTSDVRLRAWFRHSTAVAFQLLTPDTRLASAPFALHAASIPGSVFTTALNGSGTIGTSDNTPLSLLVNSNAVARFAHLFGDRVNVTLGSPSNSVGPGASASSILGGGETGYPNTIETSFATIVGGASNMISTYSEGATYYVNSLSVIGGGGFNTAVSYSGTLAGGSNNEIRGLYPTIGGGRFNSIGAGTSASTIAGGEKNAIRADSSWNVVGGGLLNEITATRFFNVVAGGHDNVVSGDYTAIGGGNGNRTSGYAATVAGGAANSASGHTSFAAGHQAKAVHDGAWVWSDATAGTFSSTGPNQFLIRANGGVGVNLTAPAATLHVNGTGKVQGGNNWDLTNTEGDFRVGNDTQRFKIGIATVGGGAGDVWMRAHGGSQRLIQKAPGGFLLFSNEANTAGVSLAAGGGGWTTISDRHAKENFAAIDPLAILARVAALPLTSWNYKAQDAAIRHVGPMAQDFRAAFGVGESDTGITTVDADGIALAAIQGVNLKLQQSERRLSQLASENTALRAELAELRAAVAKLVPAR